MVGQAAILVRPIAGVQEPRECRLQAARGALQAVGRDLLGGEAIPQGQAWLQEGLDLPGEDGRRGRRLLEEAGTAVDEMVIAGLLVGRRERAVDGGPVAHQEPVDVGAQQRLGVGGAAAGRNREHRRVRRGGGKQPVGHPAHAPPRVIDRDTGAGPHALRQGRVGRGALAADTRHRRADPAGRHAQPKGLLQHGGGLAQREAHLRVEEGGQRAGVGPQLGGRGAERIRRLARMPALHPGAARDTVADVDPNPGHADRADDRFLVLLLDPVVRDHPATRRAARRQRRGELFVHLRRDVPAALRPVLGPTLPARFPGSRLRRALRERGRLALPRALGRRQLLLESVPLSAEPIPLGCQARALVLQAVPLVLQASDLPVLLRTVAAQPSVGVLELFDAFPGRAAEDSHPRDDSRRQGFCPGLAEKPNVSAGTDMPAER